MTGERHDDNDTGCTAGDAEHMALIQIEFMADVDEDGNLSVSSAMVKSHIHQAPPGPVVMALLSFVNEITAEWLAHEQFGWCADMELAHRLGEAAAVEWLKQLLDQLPKTANLSEISIPDDISELLTDE